MGGSTTPDQEASKVELSLCKEAMYPIVRRMKSSFEGIVHTEKREALLQTLDRVWGVLDELEGLLHR